MQIQPGIRGGITSELRRVLDWLRRKLSTRTTLLGALRCSFAVTSLRAVLFLLIFANEISQRCLVGSPLGGLKTFRDDIECDLISSGDATKLSAERIFV